MFLDDIIGPKPIKESKKIKGADGKACWPGYRYNGTEDGKDSCVKVKKVKESAEQLNVGDPVVITGNVQFNGSTGDIAGFGQDKRFVIVDLYNHGQHSFHSSDVSYNDYDEDSEDDADGFYVIVASEDEGVFIGALTQDGGRWRETTISGTPPYNWGGNFMSYLTPNDIMKHIQQDYRRGYQVAGPFYDDDEVRAYAQNYFDADINEDDWHGTGNEPADAWHLPAGATLGAGGAAPMAESQGLGDTIRQLYQSIYDQGDDALEYLNTSAPLFAQFWDQYEGDLDSMIAELSPKNLARIAKELQAVADQEGLAEGISKELRLAVYQVILDIHFGAKYGDEMIDKVTDELGDYFDDVQASGDPILQKVYAYVRQEGAEAEGDPARMDRVALNAIEFLNYNGARGTLNELAPGNGNDSGGDEDALFQYAKMWFSAPDFATQQRVEQALAKIGWDIGPLESEEGGAYVMRVGDEDGDSYIGWSEEELAGGLDEGANDAAPKMGTKERKLAQGAVKGAKDMSAALGLVRGKDGVARLPKDKKTGVAEGSESEVIQIMKMIGRANKERLEWQRRGYDTAELDQDIKNLQLELRSAEKDWERNDQQGVAEATSKPLIRKVTKTAPDGRTYEVYELLSANGVTIKTGMSKETAMSALKHYRQQYGESAAWQKKSGKNKNGGLNQKGVDSYRREHPGSKLQTAVTTKPSKLKPGSKDAKRRKSFCARMSGVDGPMKKPNGEPTRKALALRKWNCESVEDFNELMMIAESIYKGKK